MVLFLLLSACDGEKPADDTAPSVQDTAPDAVDADGDGVPEGADCDDANMYAYPGADEIPYDGVDQDCDGADLTDNDGDGYVGVNGGGDDCNDANPDVHPGAEVVCYDLIDEDCQEGWSQYDCDGDGYDVSDDCLDEDPASYPGATDTWYDGVDSDCDRRDDYDQDEDGEERSDDGGTDCDDLDPLINTEADEIWDRVDNDCDAEIDAFTNHDTSSHWSGDNFESEGGFGDDLTMLADLDGDGHHDFVVGVPTTSTDVGRVYVLPYAEGLGTPNADALATIDGDASSLFGSSVATVEGPAGTLLAVGAPGVASVYLFDLASSVGGVSLTTADSIASITSGSYYIGARVRAWDDPRGGQSLMVSSYEVEDMGMEVTVYAGERLDASVPDTLASWTWTATGDAYDANVLSDLDGDGLDELGMVTSGYNDNPRAYVVSGESVAAGGVDSSATSLTGFAGRTYVKGIEDLDGDGYEDLLLSDVAADGSASVGGRVWIVGGPDATTSGAVDDLAMATVSGVTDNGGLRAGSGLSDMDADGGLDLVVCAPGDGESSVVARCGWVSGAAIAAGGDLAPGTATPSFTSTSTDDQLGMDAIIDDADGDGDDDLWITGAGDAGTVLLYLRE